MQQRWVSKKREIVCATVLVVCLALIWGWGPVIVSVGRQPTTIADIAYDRRTRSRGTDFRVYLEENGDFVPYLVLTANYGGNVLLLREFLLDENMPFNISPHGPNLWSRHDYGAYYPDSHIDNFLNAEFKDSLGEVVIAAMVPSDIVITDKSAWGGGIGRTGASRVITRYIFLLSLRELGVPDSRINVPEGRALRFFRGFHIGRVATFACGTASPYWTRTPTVWETYTPTIIATSGVGGAVADRNFGIRPAFSLARSTPITTRTDIISGETVFVLCSGN